jgi:hypothetical protein
MAETSSDTIKILTLLNVSQAKPTKRVRESSRDWFKLAKKANLSTSVKPKQSTKVVDVDAIIEDQVAEEEEEEEDGMSSSSI